MFKLNADGEIDKDYLAGDGRFDVIDYTSTAELYKEADKNFVFVDADGDTDTDDRTRYYISEDTVFIKALNSDGELDPSVIDYEDIYKSAIDITDTDTDSLVFVYADGANKDANLIVFLDKNFVGADDDYFYGVVTDDPWKVGSDYVVSIDVQGEGEVEYVVDDEADWANGMVVEFHLNSDGEIVRRCCWNS
ncbi:MAG: hypothetical protein ACOX7R_04020 [Acetivibrionales bacterium]